MTSNLFPSGNILISHREYEVSMDAGKERRTKPDYLEAIEPSESQKLAKILNIILSTEEFRNVEFVIFHGSRARGTGMKTSDMDICIYFRGKGEEMSRFRLKLLSGLPSYCDVQIFQQLPLYIRKEVLKGKVLYAKNMTFLYEVALNTIRDFEYFKPRFYYYIYR